MSSERPKSATLITPLSSILMYVPDLGQIQIVFVITQTASSFTSKYLKVFCCILKYIHTVLQLQIQILPVTKTQITNTNTNTFKSI